MPPRTPIGIALLLGQSPGHTTALLFSEGFVANPGAAIASALVSYYGPEQVSAFDLEGNLRIDVRPELQRLQGLARENRVSIFTFDTRDGAGGSFSGRLDRAQPRRRNTQGYDPWSDVFSASRGDLQTLAKETGGDDYRGSRDLLASVETAVRHYDATYRLGI